MDSTCLDIKYVYTQSEPIKFYIGLLHPVKNWPIIKFYVPSPKTWYRNGEINGLSENLIDDDIKTLPTPMAHKVIAR